MTLFNEKRISDPVHGNIGLSKVELRVISTRSFQRLRNVKHLGLVDYVFPGATYARFSHCLGACHLTGRILEALRQNGVKVEEEEVQPYRMAALLHDIGHYPFSHVLEGPVKDYYRDHNAEPLAKPKSVDKSGVIDPSIDESGPPPFFDHEDLGKEIVTRDPQLTSVLTEAGLDPSWVASMFKGERPYRFTNLISSDLDADRIDYLLRTAHHTGLPYGSVDLDYILSQMRVDGEDNLCLTRKALRAADHFLLCRYFDYMQVSYHKTVAAFELILKDVVRSLIESDLLDCSGQHIRAEVANHTWWQFDDMLVLQRIKELMRSKSCDEVCRAQSQAIMERRPPRMLKEDVSLEERSYQVSSTFKKRVAFLREHIPTWAARFGVDERLWYLWHKTQTLTEVGPHFDAHDLARARAEDGDDPLRHAVRILDNEGSSSSPITEVEDALTRPLGDRQLLAIRLYVLLPEDEAALETDIRNHIEKEWPP